MTPCGTCPACTGELQGLTECDRVLEARLLDDPRLSDLFAILTDPTIPPPMPTRELQKLRAKGAA